MSAHVSDRLYELLAGDLANSELVVVNDHLRCCESCREGLVEASMAHALLTSVRDVLTPELAGGGRSVRAESLPELPPLDLDAPEALSGRRPPARGQGGPAPSRRGRSRRSFELVRRLEEESPAAGFPSLTRPLAQIGEREVAPSRRTPLGQPSRAVRDVPRRSRRAELANAHGRHRAKGAAGLVGATAVALVVSLVLSLGGTRPTPAPPGNGSRIVLTAELLPLPAAPAAMGRVTVRADGDVTIATEGLPAASRGHYYEVWLLGHGHAKLPIGRLPASGRGRFSFPPKRLRAYTAVVVSLQPKGSPLATGVGMLSTTGATSHTSRVADARRVPRRSGHRRHASRRGTAPSTHHPASGPTVQPQTQPLPAVPDVQPPPVVKKLLSDSERHLTLGHVLVVDTTSDGNALHPASGLCRDAAGRCSLRAAIEVANTRRVPMTIRLPAGTYRLRFGPLVASDPSGVTIVGASTGRTVISVGGRTSRILVVRRPGVTGQLRAIVSLQNLTLTGGTAPSAGPWAGDGGAVLVSDAADLLELSRVSITDSRAAGSGGGLFARGEVWATEADFTHDTAGISGGGAQFERNEAVVTESVFDGDSAGSRGTPGGEGGAVDDGGAALVLVYSNFADDSAAGTASARGGALLLDGPAWIASDTFSSDGATARSTGSRQADATATAEGGAVDIAAVSVTIESCAFSSDETEGGRSTGGALYAAVPLTVADSRFIADDALASPSPARDAHVGTLGLGGAVYSESVLRLEGTRFAGDGAATNGGAVFADGPATIRWSIFTGDSASADGGSIYASSSLALTHATLQRSVALLGGGLYAAGSLWARADTVVDNRALGTLGAGGGFFLYGGRAGTQGATAAGAEFELSLSTIAGNVAAAGAGIAEEAAAGKTMTASISRSTVAANNLPSGAEEDCAAVAATTFVLRSGGGNVIGDTTCHLAASSDRQGPADEGYWLAAATGGVWACGGSSTYGTLARSRLRAPVVAIAADPGGSGYWEVTANGQVFAFGSAEQYGAAGSQLGGGVVTGFAAAPDGGGYWMVTSLGRVLAFGDAGYFGSAVGEHIVGMARTADGGGYWLLGADGRVYAFGDAPHLSSRMGIQAAAIVATPDGQGYWVATKDGAVFAFGDAGSFGGVTTSGVVALLPTADGRGYLIVNARGEIFAEGDAPTPTGTVSGTVVAATN